jgi:hypothetical protein
MSVMGVFINFRGFVDIPNINKADSNVSRNMQSYKSKGKEIPLQVLTGPAGSRRLRFPDLKKIGTKWWPSCQPYAPAAFTPRKYPLYSFLLEAESTPGP